ncbi:MAG: manganese efflux pump MntP family protein [Ignavibacteriae bacterium]|nr:manganese efflux pump MntP family protein [Ignavibacteriota bacterium]
MSFIEILFIAVGLAMDAFAVSLGAGTIRSNQGYRTTFRLAFHFGLFQFIMPVIGWFLGRQVDVYIQSYDHWIVFILLAYIGGKMIYSGLDTSVQSVRKDDPSKGMNLILLSFATSLDALAVGISFAVLDVNIWYPSFVIGVVTAVICVAGVLIGNKLGAKFGKIMEIFGGAVLIAIGLKILITHLFLQ